MFAGFSLDISLKKTTNLPRPSTFALNFTDWKQMKVYLLFIHK